MNNCPCVPCNIIVDVPASDLVGSNKFIPAPCEVTGEWRFYLVPERFAPKHFSMKTNADGFYVLADESPEDAADSA